MTTDEHIIHAAELVVRAMLGQDPTPAAVTHALAAAGLLRTRPATVYRADWETESIGLYASRDVAEAVCVLAAMQGQPEAVMVWDRLDDDPDGVTYLRADGANTEYYITPLSVRLTVGDVE
ncbi:hypothetical protein ACWC5I_28070 [Kitasatospora sp. NPDC001574]